MATSILKGTLSRPAADKQTVAMTPSVKFSESSTRNETFTRNGNKSKPQSKISQFFSELCLPLNSCRKQTLKRVHCRTVLVAICALVVIECICVLSELMVDLQGIKFRFENEAREINEFVEHFKDKYPQAFENVDIRRTKDFLQLLKASVEHRVSDHVISKFWCSFHQEINSTLRNDVKRFCSSYQNDSFLHIVNDHGRLKHGNDIDNAVTFPKERPQNKSQYRKTTQAPKTEVVTEVDLKGTTIIVPQTGSEQRDSGIRSLEKSNDSKHIPDNIMCNISCEHMPTRARDINVHEAKSKPDNIDTGSESSNAADGSESAAGGTDTESRSTMNTTITGHGNIVRRDSNDSTMNREKRVNVSKADTPFQSLTTNSSWISATTIRQNNTNDFDTVIQNVENRMPSSFSISSTSSEHSYLELKNETATPVPVEGQGRFSESSLDVAVKNSRFEDHKVRRSALSENRSDHNKLLDSLSNLFILEVNSDKENVFLMMELLPDRVKNNETKYLRYKDEYKKIYTTSKALHFTSLSILGIMVIETIVKLFCTGLSFFKKKLEVFDALIVVSSFALDVMFLDSRWYETGKDATALLVLLLPWRVVRIVNSFLMTVKHKHHLQMMNLKRGKKKAEIKMAKLQTLLSEIRKDVQLLTNLCRFHDVDENSINACLYGKGRRGATLDAMTTCVSLMLISTLGKDTLTQDEDVYSMVIQEVLREGSNSAEDQDRKQAEEEALDAAIAMEEKIEAKRKSRRPSRLKRALLKRSYTIPRRCASLEIPDPEVETNNGNNVFYINDQQLPVEENHFSRPESTFVIVSGANATPNDDVFYVSDDGGSAESTRHHDVSEL